MHFTRRDAMIACASIVLTCSVGALAQGDKAILGPAVFDWNALPVTANETGSVRQVVKQPTATLNELEMHITTLNPGVASHPPHKHPNEELVIIREGNVETLSGGVWKRAEFRQQIMALGELDREPPLRGRRLRDAAL